VSDDEEILVHTTPSSPVGLHRVTDPAGAALPQAARVVDASPELWPDEVLIAVETLNLDAASFRQLSEKHEGDGDAVRAEVLDIVAARGKMQNRSPARAACSSARWPRSGPTRRSGWPSATGSPPWCHCR
jgi:L-erythro-3,5-diaminohexanoate dehydrogenase